MSIISFGPNQKLTQQQRTAYQTSQKVKQAVWDTSHRLASLNNVPGVDDPNNGDNVDIRSATPLPAAHAQSVAKFDASATGSVKRDENGQLQKADVKAQLADGRQWDLSYQHEGDTLAYSAPSPSGQGQVHVLENLSNGTIAMFEAPQLVPDFAEQLQNFEPAAPAAPMAPPPSAPGWAAPAAAPGLLDKAGGFFKKLTGGASEQPQQADPAQTAQAQSQEPPAPTKSFSEMAQEGKTKAKEAVQSETGRKWGNLLIGKAGMGFLDQAMNGSKES
jgi:hypothetical protein